MALNDFITMFNKMLLECMTKPDLVLHFLE